MSPAALVPASPLITALSAPIAVEPAVQAPALDVFWDGFQAAKPSDELPSLSADRIAPWLAAPDVKTAAALDGAVVLARRTRVGRRAMDAAEKILSKRRLPVLIGDLHENYGEYDYVDKNLRLNASLFNKGREANLATTLTHELTHIVQHDEGLPSNALEMEIEAHLNDLEMLRELGVKPAEHSFARQALSRLRQGTAQFIDLIQDAAPASVFLGDSSMDEVIDQMEENLADMRARHSRYAKGLARVIKDDLNLIYSRRGRASYQAYSRRVMALLRRHAAQAQRHR